MTRSVLRFVNWRITSTDRPAPLHQMECLTCLRLNAREFSDGKSPLSEAVTEVQDWALHHSGRNPSHTTYREHVERTWRTSMVDSPAP